MTKKLKQHTYKSKTDFVVDINLIWDNCLRYNDDMSHPLRRMANGMRKEAEKLIPLIPDIVIRPRAEVEAEERRKQLGGDDEDSDDEPIMSSRGRTAGTKKGSSKSRKAHDRKEGTPSVEQKPVLHLNGLLGKAHREGSEIMDGSNGLATPPVGSITPSAMNGMGSNTDAMDIDGPSMNGLQLATALEHVYEDDEFKVWKQITKKDRARVAKARHSMFKGDKLNADEPALLRTKAGIRKMLKRKRLHEMGIYTPSQETPPAADDSSKPIETLAEGIEAQVEEEAVIPDYYEPLNVMPDIPRRLQWQTDAEGHVINQHEDLLRVVEPGHFTAPPSHVAKVIDANLHQIQETRKLCSKISAIKQMQIQAQVYTSQFSKYSPDAFVEADAEPHYYCGDGPIMATETCRAAMQRSVAKLFYHAGFEELQPSALDAVTDIAGDYFQRLVQTFNVYRESEKKEVHTENGVEFAPRFTPEEVLLHTLVSNGTDLETLETYVREDLDKLGNKLGTIHDRMKAYLADLLRPALTDVDGDGAGAFNDDSGHFVNGDFAEELGDDFFGFRALGLDKELGLQMLSVPLHLLQSRVRNQYQSTQAVGGPSGTATQFMELAPLEPVTKETVRGQVGLVRNFFLEKLATAKEGHLIEDKDLPVKQQRPRPRLGPTGKIISPQKRPPKEQIALAKKRKKLELQMKDASPDKMKQLVAKTMQLSNVGQDPVLTLAPSMSREPSLQSGVEEKEEDGAPISPESMEQ